MFKINRSERFKRNYRLLPKNIQKKTDQQLRFLSQNLRHPSLRAKKIRGYEDVWEARITRSYRFVFQIEDKNIDLLTIGPHDEVFRN